jgi:hypothetical protein
MESIRNFQFRPFAWMIHAWKKTPTPLVLFSLEHLQPLEAPRPKFGEIFIRTGYKTGVDGNIFLVGTPAFAHQRGYSFKIASSRYTKASPTVRRSDQPQSGD